MNTSINGDRKRLQTLLTWVYTSLGIGLLIVPSTKAETPFSGDIELFKVLATAQRDNAERISSWQGSSRVEATRTDPNGIVYHDISVNHFIYGREHNATRWNWTPVDRHTRIEGKLVATPLEDNKQNEMRKGDAFYTYNLGVTTKEGEKRGALVIWPVYQAEEGVFSSSFDPMWYLTGEWTGSDDLPTRLMKFYQMAKDPNFTDPYAKYTLTRNGPLVALVIENPTAVMTNRLVFDLSKGGTLASHHATWKENVQTLEWTYEDKEGIWIPKTVTRTMKERDPSSSDGSIKYTKVVTFVENTLNEPVPASEFSLEKLGLKVGDMVSDHKLGVRYQYGK